MMRGFLLDSVRVVLSPADPCDAGAIEIRQALRNA
jgi:hypothetical protein